MSNLQEFSGQMARVLSFYVGVLAGLVFFSEALRNTTEGPSANETECHHHSNRDNCTDTGQWNGHFSSCPEELTYYCVHGECRYIREMKEPSCRCEPGFFGSRCEMLDFDRLTAERKQIIIICVTVGLVILILFLIFICFISHRRGRFCKEKHKQRNKPRNGSEKLHNDVTLSLMSDSTEQPHAAGSVI